MSELSVITKSKKLMEYILTITKKSDVKYRFTFVNKMHNLCMEIIENLYSANFTKLGSEKRNEYQVNAQAKLHYLDFVCEMAKNANCITVHQYSFIAKNILECINLLCGWMKSDSSRVNL